MSSLEQAFDAEQFRKLGHELVDLLADHLHTTRQPNDLRVIPWQEPEESLAKWHDLDRSSDLIGLFRSVVDNSVHLHNPRFLGHQISPPLPISALSSLVVDLLNNGMGVYEMGIAGTAIEQTVVKMTAKQMGFEPKAGGFLTSGGSLANLTAILAARQARRQRGPEGRPLSIMVSDEAHYCIGRSVRITGIADEGVIRVPTNERFQMQTDQLDRLHEEATANGREVIAVVGSACSTSTGSFDDLQRIGDYCRRHGLWFHVDGAHGAAMAFSSKYRDKVAGIELADSVAMDFHKMLLTPAIVSLLIFREEQVSYQTFRQKADYLWAQSAKSEESEWFNLAKRTFECTKSMMCLKIYSIIKAHGLEVLDANVTRVVDLAHAFAELITQRRGFELAVPPETNIVCFRYLGEPAADEPSTLNARIREALVRQGRFYIVQTTLNGETWLRTTLANPFTSIEDLTALLGSIEQLAERIMTGEGPS